MPESTADSVETRRKEDHDFVINLLVNAIETECEPNDVSKTARLGKREGTHRPVLVEQDNEEYGDGIYEQVNVC